MSIAISIESGESVTVQPNSAYQRDHTVLDRLVSVRPDHRRSTLWVTIRRGTPLHISGRLIDELLLISEAIKGLPDAPFRYRVLRSQLPGTFSLGGDLAFFLRCIEWQDRLALTRYAYTAVAAIYENICGSGYQNLTTVSLVEGEAQGGGFEAALSSHILVAERGTHFGFPEGLFGLFPGMGGAPLLEARCGKRNAGEILGSARRWSADELYERGAIDVLAEKGKGIEVVRSITSEPSCSTDESRKSRFRHISEDDLLETATAWVERAMELPSKQCKAMKLIMKAQRVARERRETSHVNMNAARA